MSHNHWPAPEIHPPCPMSHPQPNRSKWYSILLIPGSSWQRTAPPHLAKIAKGSSLSLKARRILNIVICHTGPHARSHIKLQTEKIIKRSCLNKSTRNSRDCYTDRGYYRVLRGISHDPLHIWLGLPLSFFEPGNRLRYAATIYPIHS